MQKMVVFFVDDDDKQSECRLTVCVCVCPISCRIFSPIMLRASGHQPQGQ